MAEPEGKVAGTCKAIARQPVVKLALKAKDLSAQFPASSAHKTT